MMFRAGRSAEAYGCCSIERAPLSVHRDDVVLLIEDDADIRAAMSECLEGEGFTVVGAATLLQAIARARALPARR
jgi:ActR/RegA family two-component response regulator